MSACTAPLRRVHAPFSRSLLESVAGKRKQEHTLVVVSGVIE